LVSKYVPGKQPPEHDVLVPEHYDGLPPVLETLHPGYATTQFEVEVQFKQPVGH